MAGKNAGIAKSQACFDETFEGDPLSGQENKMEIKEAMNSLPQEMILPEFEQMKTK